LTANAVHQRRARTAARDKPSVRDMLISRPLHAVVGLRDGPELHLARESQTIIFRLVQPPHPFPRETSHARNVRF